MAKTKNDLIEEALAKGFKKEELSDLTKTQLIELMEQADESESSSAKSENVVEDLDDFDGDEIHVHQSHPTGESEYVRTYSEKEHGKDFLDLAKSFGGKKLGRFFVK